MTARLLIGWASADITPDRPVQLQGQFHQRISQRVRDPITATALALEIKGEDGDQAVIVSCDLVGVSKDLQETVREKVAARVGDLDVKKVFMAATHTHTGPVLHESLRYPDLPDGVMSPAESRGLVVDGVSEAVITAWNGRKEGSAGWALGHAAVGFNRRLSYADGNSQMYGKSDRPDFMQVEGCQDPGIEILFTWNAAGAPTGVVVNPACPSQVVEGKLFLSADFWDEARLRLKRRFGSDFSVLPLCSAAGDQSPRDLVRRGRGEADMRDEGGLIEMGRRIANAVEDVHEKARARMRSEVILRHSVVEISLPGIQTTEEALAKVREQHDEYKAEDPERGSPHWGKMQWCASTLERFKDSTRSPDFRMELHVLRLGDVAFCTNPFELFLDYGFRMKARSVAEQTFVVQLACDTGGYLPTAKAIAGAGYGATAPSNRVGPDGGQLLVDRTVAAINSLWEQDGAASTHRAANPRP